MSELRFEPFEDGALADFLVASAAAYVSERVLAGDTSAEAEASAAASLGRLFPGGAPAGGQLAGRLLADGRAVGTLWIGPAAEDRSRWWVWNIEIDEAERRRGHGRAAMRLAVGHGATSIGLNVFAHNLGARRLYDSLGYEESSVQMRKDLPGPGD